MVVVPKKTLELSNHHAVSFVAAALFHFSGPMKGHAPARWRIHWCAPPTDLVTALQHLLI
jgi:hypothetical protein